MEICSPDLIKVQILRNAVGSEKHSFSIYLKCKEYEKRMFVSIGNLSQDLGNVLKQIVAISTGIARIIKSPNPSFMIGSANCQGGIRLNSSRMKVQCVFVSRRLSQWRTPTLL
jgi:hypothetical protein